MIVKINNKTYNRDQLGFKDMLHMEDMGYPISTLFQEQKIASMATAFTGVVVGCDKEEAENLVEQHIMGGGNIADILNAFGKAVEESGFFKKLLGNEEQKSETAKKVTVKK